MPTIEWKTKRLLVDAAIANQWDQWVPSRWKALEPSTTFSRPSTAELLRVVHTSYLPGGRMVGDWVVEHSLAGARRIYHVKVGKLGLLTDTEPANLPDFLVPVHNGKELHSFAQWLVDCFIAATHPLEHTPRCRTRITSPARDRIKRNGGNLVSQKYCVEFFPA